MEKTGYALARQVCLSLPMDELDRVLAERDARAALVYLALQRDGGKLPRAEALGLSEADYRAALAALRHAGILRAPEKPLPDANELPEYTAEDLVRRVNEDSAFRAVVQETEALYGRKLNTPETKKLLGMQDHLGLPSDVLMMLVHYVFDTYRESSGPNRVPTMRRIENEAYRWADDEVLTLDMAEEYIARARTRRSQQDKLLKVLQIRGRMPTPTERGYIDAWMDMEFDTEVIAEAYDRTVTGTGRMTWAYMNTILKRWHEQDIRTLAAVRERDPRGAQRRQQTTGTQGAAQRNDLARAQQLLRGMQEKKE